MIDTDQLDEGRRVISDLHGGDADDIKAMAEYNEIKDMVEKDVRAQLHPPFLQHSNAGCYRGWPVTDHICRCGDGTSSVC